MCIIENLINFILKRLITNATYLLQRVMERCQRSQKDLHTIFTDLENVYNKVSREIFLLLLDYTNDQHSTSTYLHWSDMCLLGISKNEYHCLCG
ncbi:hypothetical protein Lal_00036513 [Lupinus albus]|nr:hypothetical protein Lal_00036513 [Lupinus albus]